MKTKGRIRTIITQDAEIDDQNSLRHFLLYANEMDLQGIVQTSSIFHWKGVEGAATPAPKENSSFPNNEVYPYDKPYRWTGTDWMFRVIDDYAKVYLSLSNQDANYPSPDELTELVKIGNVGYPGEVLSSTEGSELIRKTILDSDERTLYLQVWGGTNTIARALMDIENANKRNPNWETLHDAISRKVVLTACGEQDNTYRNYIAEEWPDIQYVNCMQMGSYAYAWGGMPEGESKDTLRGDFMKKEILTGHGALMDGYAVWADGKYYEGETNDNQFGTNPSLLTKEGFWGTRFGIGPYAPYDFLSEGDSPTYFLLLDSGFRTLENFSYGGLSGRYLKDEQEVNSKGEHLNYWKVQQDVYVDWNGQSAKTESMWPYVVDIQRDFAARASWCVASSIDEVEHAPRLTVEENLDLSAKPGEIIVLHATAKALTCEEKAIDISFHIYDDASSVKGSTILTKSKETNTAEGNVTIPDTAKEGEQLHVIVKAQNTYGHRLTHYQQIIITIQ